MNRSDKTWLAGLVFFSLLMCLSFVFAFMDANDRRNARINAIKVCAKVEPRSYEGCLRQQKDIFYYRNKER